MKLFKYQTKEPINYFNTDQQVEIPEHFHMKAMRAFWVSNVANIDLPIAFDPSYKDKVIEMLDTAVQYEMNTIFFQIRTTNDAFYQSKLNPYSRYLSGEEGKEPPFDVLEFVLKEAKKRAIEVHAWCNPYRVSIVKNMTKEAYLETCSDLNFAKQNPHLTVTDTNGQLILNPAKEAVKQFIIDSMIEILENYDVAGIHWDDYFYPYAGLKEEASDLKDFEARPNQAQTLGDFRRYHVTDIVQRTHAMIKRKFPNKKFGVSPFGIWKNKATDPKGSNTDPKCSESYSNQYADTYLWVKKGYIDYIVPQLYWGFGHHLAPFADLCQWWSHVCKDTQVDLYIGHGAYRLGMEGEYSNPEEIVNQLKYANQFDVVKGNVFFTYKSFIDQDKAKPGMMRLKELFKKKGA